MRRFWPMPGTFRACFGWNRARCAFFSASASRRWAWCSWRRGCRHRAPGALESTACWSRSQRSLRWPSPRATFGYSICRKGRCRPAERGLSFCWRNFLLAQVVRKVLSGSGECHQVNWTFLSLAMPTWVLLVSGGAGRIWPVRQFQQTAALGKQFLQYPQVHGVQGVDVGEPRAFVDLMYAGVGHAKLQHLGPGGNQEAPVRGAPGRGVSRLQATDLAHRAD